MNVFLDTSILRKDPFWKGNFNMRVLQLAKDKEINLFISSVVLAELDRNVMKIVDDENRKIESLNDQMRHYGFAEPFALIDKSKAINKLRSFYSDLIAQKIITEIKYYDSLLPEIVNRAILKQKPFSEGKTELKDAIIWLTYSSWAEDMMLEGCVLFTENVNDFCDNEKLKRNIFEIHPELKKDSNKFTVYKSSKDLIQQEEFKLLSPSKRFATWLRNTRIDNEYVLKIIENNFAKIIENKIEREIARSDVNSIFSKEYYYIDGYVTSENIEILSVENFDVDVFEDDCLISGVLLVQATANAYTFNTDKNHGEASEHFYTDTDLVVQTTFSFYYDKKEIPRLFEIDYVNILLSY